MAGSLVIAFLKWSLSSCQTLIRCSLQQSGPSKRLKLISSLMNSNISSSICWKKIIGVWCCVMQFFRISESTLSFYWLSCFLLVNPEVSKIPLFTMSLKMIWYELNFAEFNLLLKFQIKSNQTKLQSFDCCDHHMFKIKNSKLKKQFLKLQNVSKQMLPLRDSCEQIRCLI